jgi:tRNA-uridine 2-sulfurtransferase
MRVPEMRVPEMRVPEMRVMVAMSGGVDSSVAAALLAGRGHDVVGATLKLWGGVSDSGCCSVADVDDARRVAEQLGITHHVFNFTDTFEDKVVDPYVVSHATGQTPNPCIECNRHVKFGRLLERARRLGFDALATGHHAQVVGPPGGRRLVRGADRKKDQSYVLSMLTRPDLDDVMFPVGSMTKAEVRAVAAEAGLSTATKPDSQDVCFIHSSVGRREFLGRRLELHPGEIVDETTGEVVGDVDAVELVTVGQRRGLGVAAGQRRYAVAVDIAARRVVVGTAGASVTTEVDLALGSTTWVDGPLRGGAPVLAQTSAHGVPAACTWGPESVVFDAPHSLVAPGQTIAFYDRDEPEVVVGSAIAALPGCRA